MDPNNPRKLETEALIAAIWGPRSTETPVPSSSEDRKRQNKALASAMKAYLQQYLADL